MKQKQVSFIRKHAIYHPLHIKAFFGFSFNICWILMCFFFGVVIFFSNGIFCFVFNLMILIDLISSWFENLRQQFVFPHFKFVNAKRLYFRLGDQPLIKQKSPEFLCEIAFFFLLICCWFSVVFIFRKNLPRILFWWCRCVHLFFFSFWIVVNFIFFLLKNDFAWSTKNVSESQLCKSQSNDLLINRF